MWAKTEFKGETMKFAIFYHFLIFLWILVQPILSINEVKSNSGPLPTGIQSSVETKITEKVLVKNTALDIDCAGDYGRLYFNSRPETAICLFVTDNLGVDAGQKIALYSGMHNQNGGWLGGGGSSFLFGHNANNVLGHLASESGFRIELMDGRVFHYVIMSQEVVCDYSNPDFPCVNYDEPVLNMQDALKAERKIGRIGVALMTCAGQLIGGGDATHRRLAYAIEI